MSNKEKNTLVFGANNATRAEKNQRWKDRILKRRIVTRNVSKMSKLDGKKNGAEGWKNRKKAWNRDDTKKKPKKY